MGPGCPRSTRSRWLRLKRHIVVIRDTDPISELAPTPQTARRAVGAETNMRRDCDVTQAGGVREPDPPGHRGDAQTARECPTPARWDPSHPCADARKPTEHSHTFWPDGSFNSYDQTGNEVDNGPYNIVNDHTFIIGGRTPMTFHYRISGNTIMFDPVVPKNCSTRHCRHVLAWAFSVAYVGQTWHRVTSGSLCPVEAGLEGCTGL